MPHTQDVDLGDGRTLHIAITDEGLLLDVIEHGEVVATEMRGFDEWADYCRPLPPTNTSYTNEDGEPIMDGAAWRYEQSLDDEAQYDLGRDPYDDEFDDDE